MFCLYEFGTGVYFFNGEGIYALTDPAQINILQTIYEQNNGKNMPTFNWREPNPTANLLESIFNPEAPNTSTGGAGNGNSTGSGNSTIKVVDWFNRNRNRITYSMEGSRIGTDGTADCSGSITVAVKEATGVPYSYVYSTVTLGGYLSKCGYNRVLVGNSSGANLNQIQDEDIILLSCGSSMADSGGAGGHTGVISGGGKNITSTCYYTQGQVNTAIQDLPLNANYLRDNEFYYYEIWRPSGTPNNSAPSTGSFTLIEETGTFYPNTTVNVRDYPSTQGNIIAQYTAGESFIYDSYVVNDGYIWLSYVSYSGARRYVAWRVQGGETFGTIDDDAGNGESGGFDLVSEEGTFYPNTTVNVRDYPSLGGNIIAQYTSGESFTYDSYVVNAGYIWLSYVSYSGARRYVAWRVQGGETFGTIV